MFSDAVLPDGYSLEKCAEEVVFKIRLASSGSRSAVFSISVIGAVFMAPIMILSPAF